MKCGRAIPIPTDTDPQWTMCGLPKGHGGRCVPEEALQEKPPRAAGWAARDAAIALGLKKWRPGSSQR